MASPETTAPPQAKDPPETTVPVPVTVPVETTAPPETRGPVTISIADIDDFTTSGPTEEPVAVNSGDSDPVSAEALPVVK